ncbi:gliding motility-associated C-terminal domain-containing protein [Chitinophaga sp. Cy-1792]|uniref:gliding motility-associated C-terminal domain-containing protein n=1 Tax=Chitinophaga sp. Cy-1792 TaxID=2608339 RepID=UPI001422A5C8|nr:gliding motility-associated C-terminal domain-containing protein [Chitinophaga sp. Cy-1792]NIG55263.1 gliding motility-associated C-terminal domain-containing protein [Chitinophaga sp. Cy-1792]
MKHLNLYTLLALLIICISPWYASAQCYNNFEETIYIPGYAASGSSIIYTNDGQYLIAGKIASKNLSDTTGMLLQADNTGNVLWCRAISTTTTSGLNMLIPTPDNGYCALGTITINGIPSCWILKFNAMLDIQWQQSITVDNRPITPKSIITMENGGYALVGIANDSTAKSDGVLLVLSSTGDVLASQIYDGGAADGFTSILEYNGQLLITGYTGNTQRDAILMKVDINNGWNNHTTKYAPVAGSDAEGISLYAIPGGYSWSIKSEPTPPTSADVLLYNIKSTVGNNDAVTLTQAFNISGSGVYHCKVLPRQSEAGIAFLTNGPSYATWMSLSAADFTGRHQWSRHYTYARGEFSDFVTTGQHGYAVTGYATAFENGVALMRTDNMGRTGSCAGPTNGSGGGGSSQLAGNSWTWNKTVVPVCNINSVIAAYTDKPTHIELACKYQDCMPAPPTDNGNACATSFTTILKDENYTTEIYDANRTADGDIVTIGTRYSGFSGGPTITKLKPGGNLRWAKQLKNTRFGEDFSGRYQQVINTSDQHFLVGGVEYVGYNHGVSDSAVLMKMDYDGNLIWSKRMATWYADDLKYLFEAENGDYITCHNQDYGHGGCDNAVMRLDKNGNMIWQQKITGWSASNRHIRAMLYEQGSIYLLFDNYIQNLIQSLAVMKLDAATGKLLWTKTITDANNGFTPMGMVLINDVLYIGIGLSIGNDYFDRSMVPVVAKLKGATGEQLPGFKLNNTRMWKNRNVEPFIDYTNVTFTKSADNQLVFARESVAKSGVGYNLMIHKIGTDGTVTWSRDYTQLNNHQINSLRADNAGFIISGFSYGTDIIKEAANEGFVLRVNSAGEIENSSGNCLSQANVAGPGGITTSPNTFTEDPTEKFESEPATIGHRFTNPWILDDTQMSYPACASFSACTPAMLSGPDVICDREQIWSYTAVKDPNCHTSLVWQIDPAYVDIMATAADNISLKFKKAGKTNVKVQVDAGCGMLPASVIVDIPIAASTLELGPDLELCKDAVLQLDAGTTFNTYRWSNGSITHNTTVNKPGTYSLTVTDKCNHSATDAVVVKDGNDYPFSLGADIAKCAENRITRAIPAGFTNYTWNNDYKLDIDGNNAGFYTDRDATYILQAERSNGCVFKDTLAITIKPPMDMGLASELSICDKDEQQVSIAGTFSNITWNNGSSGNDITLTAAGTYIAGGTGPNGCLTADTLLLHVNPLPEVTLPQEQYICEGTLHVLDAGTDGTSYTWSTGETTRKIIVKTTGEWTVNVTNQYGCNTSATAWFREYSKPPSGFLVADTTLCTWGEITIPVRKPYVAYRWSDGSTANHYTTGLPGLYALEVTDALGCTGKEYVRVTAKSCGWGIYVPNAFTPNNDGQNDVLRPRVFGNVSRYQFSVFDRWGNLVYQSNSINQGWNGKNKNLDAPAGTYVWMCIYQMQNEPEQVSKGTAVLLR